MPAPPCPRPARPALRVLSPVSPAHHAPTRQNVANQPSHSRTAPQEQLRNVMKRQGRRCVPVSSTFHNRTTVEAYGLGGNPLGSMRRGGLPSLFRGTRPNLVRRSLKRRGLLMAATS